jgi:hypothetical protein
VSGILATVFGLDVRADRPLSFLQTARAAPTGREVEVSLAGYAAGLGWPEGAELISDQRLPDGTVSFQIERSAEAGHRIWGPAYGVNLISGDGRRLRGAPGSGGMGEWQRLLIAQALPFAAVLQGLEVLHAGAVTIDGGAVGFVGPSGAGKTSLALALCRRGAGFLADDVLALERVGEELIGHPGTPVAGIDHAEADRLRHSEGVEEQEVLSVNSREQVARVPVSAEPAPLRALFFLDRRPDGPAEPRFERVGDAQMLLAATFNLVLATPERLRGLLDVCALAARWRVERIVTGPATDASELSVAVERRLSPGT